MLVIGISIASTAIPWGYVTLTHDAGWAFIVAFLSYLMAHVCIGIVKKATGRDAFKNTKRAVVMMLFKAAAFAVGLVMLVGPILAGTDALWVTCGGRLHMDVLSAVSSAIVYLGLTIAIAVITNASIKGE